MDSDLTIQQAWPLVIKHLADTISYSLDNKELCAGVFLGLSKAFDTVNPGILSQKLEFYGIRGLAHDWIKSYRDRKQSVAFGENFSDYQTVKCGIQQGSILGPLPMALHSYFT